MAGWRAVEEEAEVAGVGVAGLLVRAAAGAFGLSFRARSPQGSSLARVEEESEEAVAAAEASGEVEGAAEVVRDGGSSEEGVDGGEEEDLVSGAGMGVSVLV